jgi:hypothetical protein
MLSSRTSQHSLSIVLGLIFLAALAAFGLGKVVLNRITPPTAGTPAAQFKIENEDTQRQIVFSKNPSTEPNATDSLQAWIMNPDGSDQRQLPVSKFSSVYKYPESNLVFFTSYNDPASAEAQGSFFVYDLASGETTEHVIPVIHPKPGAKTNISIQALRNIAPDGSAIVVLVDFYEDCPPAEYVGTFQGGVGPCQPEPDQTVKTGSYLYNLKTKEAKYIGGINVISTWKLSEGVLYAPEGEYVDGKHSSHLKKITIATGESSTIQTVPVFGYAAAPLFKTNRIIRIVSNLNDNDPSAYARLELSSANEEPNVVLSTKWADLQPVSLIVAPDESGVLFNRTHLLKGLGINTLHWLDLKTGEVKKLSPENDERSYLNYGGVWVSNTMFVMEATPVEGPNNFSTKRLIVAINVQTGEITDLTQQDVYRLNGY